MEEGEEKERKKKRWGFPRAEPALLAMLWVTDVRYS
jgi:hypothetical protein